MELIEGFNMEEAIKLRELNFAKQALEGLEATHKAGLLNKSCHLSPWKKMIVPSQLPKHSIPCSSEETNRRSPSSAFKSSPTNFRKSRECHR